MKKSFSKLFLAPLTVLVLTSFAMAPVAEARGVVVVAVGHAQVAGMAVVAAPSRSIIPVVTCVPTMCAVPA